MLLAHLTTNPPDELIGFIGQDLLLNAMYSAAGMEFCDTPCTHVLATEPLPQIFSTRPTTVHYDSYIVQHHLLWYSCTRSKHVFFSGYNTYSRTSCVVVLLLYFLCTSVISIARKIIRKVIVQDKM